MRKRCKIACLAWLLSKKHLIRTKNAPERLKNTDYEADLLCVRSIYVQIRDGVFERKQEKKEKKQLDFG